MTDQQTWAAYHTEIDKRLDALRPQRSSSGDKDWREPVYGWARNHIPNESNLVRHFAEKEVDAREGKATRRGNKMLRRWAKGQIPLVWSDLGPLPVVLNGTRIRMDALTPDDMDDAAQEIESNGKQVFAEVLLLAESLRKLAQNARRAGYSFVAEVGDLDPLSMEVIEDDEDDEEDDEDPDDDGS